MTLSPLLCLSLKGCGAADQQAPGGGDQGYEVAGESRVEGNVLGGPGTISDIREGSGASLGARITGTVLSVRLPLGAAGSARVDWDTAVQPIPGLLDPLVAGDALTVTVSRSAGDLSLARRSSSVSVNTFGVCPSGVGDRISGELSRVVVEAADGMTWTFSPLTFDLLVTSVSSPDLRCVTGEIGGGGGLSTGFGDCDHRLCDELNRGCCAVRRCLDQCRNLCRLNNCEEGTQGCPLDCWLGCLESCQPSGVCRSNVHTLWSCQIERGCHEAENEDECTGTHCCEELRAAY